jgi:hypothetical protein
LCDLRDRERALQGQIGASNQPRFDSLGRSLRPARRAVIRPMATASALPPSTWPKSL